MCSYICNNKICNHTQFKYNIINVYISIPFTPPPQKKINIILLKCFYFHIQLCDMPVVLLSDILQML